jgi:hypothetical protein
MSHHDGGSYVDRRARRARCYVLGTCPARRKRADRANRDRYWYVTFQRFVVVYQKMQAYTRLSHRISILITIALQSQGIVLSRSGNAPRDSVSTGPV